MTVMMRQASREDTAGDLATPDAAWRELVTEAALAAGVSRGGRESGARAYLDDRALAAADAEDPSHDLVRAIRTHSTRVAMGPTARLPEPDSGLEATLRGELLKDARVFKSASRVDLAAQELRLTCQAGQFSVHDAAHSAFTPEHGCAFGTFNVAEAGVVASVPASQLAGARTGVVCANVYIPVAFDNTLQRVWRLAVPSADMRLDPDRPHFAVVGVRGSITLTVRSGDGPPETTRRDFVRRSLSAHAPSEPDGFGPVRGAHLLQLELDEIEPGSDLTAVVNVTLMSLLAGDPAAYRPGAPFYAGIDFGGDGAYMLPHECLSAFEIPLTPLIENQPITLSEIAFVGRSHG